jgi:hypothetical protein
VRTVLQKHLDHRIRWDGRLVLLLARASNLLLNPWELCRNEALQKVMDAEYRLRDLSPDRAKWQQRIAGLRIKAKRILDAYDVLEKRLPDCLSGALLSNRGSNMAKRLSRINQRWKRYFSNWSAQQRAVTAELELEYTSGKLLETAVGVSSEYLESVDEEHAQILAHGFDRSPYLRLRIKSYVYDHRNEPRMMSDITRRATKEFNRLGILNKQVHEEKSQE